MKQKILLIFQDWQFKLDNDEWYFQNAFEELTIGLTPVEAYDSIPTIIEVLFEMEDHFLIEETMDILLGIYHIADTTEIHPFIEMQQIEQHLDKYHSVYGKVCLNELKRLLRID
ncbi:ABC transporter [Gracilibacillus sp. S3-1-1]|uniref:ABC transporter n=1 Tax=Gracilibacillus pellucidus TaxID=3095368 RepID=A0ACC6M4I7_9BACI|nr:ABC transporter [Gracilibacillus sp. S3-1-1]MDX8045868.1 ABC transporter [Gracilibacillus sp. S3-1-1]